MSIAIDVSKCDGCKSCVEICPVEAIIVKEVAAVNSETCVDCGSCVDECPKGAISLPE